MQPLLDLPLPAQLALGALAITQLALQVWGLIDLGRRTVDPGRSKWPWALVIVLGGIVGAIVYLAVGRRALSRTELPSGGPLADGDRERRRKEGIDRLYDGRGR